MCMVYMKHPGYNEDMWYSQERTLFDCNLMADARFRMTGRNGHRSVQTAAQMYVK